MTPTDKTKKFIRHVKNLKESGLVRRYADIVKAMKWDKTSMSNVMNGRANIPDYKYQEFSKVYGIEVENPEKVSTENSLVIDAKMDVVLASLAEILAYQKGQTVEKIKNDLVETVNLRLKEKIEKL